MMDLERSRLRHDSRDSSESRFPKRFRKCMASHLAHSFRGLPVFFSEQLHLTLLFTTTDSRFREFFPKCSWGSPETDRESLRDSWNMWCWNGKGIWDARDSLPLSIPDSKDSPPDSQDFRERIDDLSRWIHDSEDSRRDARDSLERDRDSCRDSENVFLFEAMELGDSRDSLKDCPDTNLSHILFKVAFLFPVDEVKDSRDSR